MLKHKQTLLQYMYWELYMLNYIYSLQVWSLITFSSNYQVLLFTLVPVSNSLEIFRSQSICQCSWQHSKVHSQRRRDHYWMSNQNLHKAFLRKLCCRFVPFPPLSVSWQGQSASRTARFSSEMLTLLIWFLTKMLLTPLRQPSNLFPNKLAYIFKSLE